MLKQFPLNKINGTKNGLFFLLQAPTHHSFTFNLQLLYAHLSKTVCEISNFWFCFLFIKVYIFVQQNAWTLWISHFKILKNRKVRNSFAPRPLIFKFQQEVLTFNDFCVSWSSPKTDLETNFLNLENRSFENISFLKSNL